MKRSTIRFSASLLASILALGVTGCDDDDGDDGNDSAATDGAPTSASGGGSGDDGDDSGDSGGDDGGGSVDNVAACEDLVAALECGDQDLGMYVTCDSYTSLACDITDYFQCLEDEFTCNDGVFDPTGWMNCASMATCD